MSDAAPGIRTFLFSDIEGSTRLEQEVGTARYGEIRERHRALLRGAFAAHGGTEQGTEGDSFFIVFPSARSAVLAAIEGQRGLAAEPWPDGVRVRVPARSPAPAVVGSASITEDSSPTAGPSGSITGG